MPDPYMAYVSFDHGVRYPCQVRDPFADQEQQEEELEETTSQHTLRRWALQRG